MSSIPAVGCHYFSPGPQLPAPQICPHDFWRYVCMYVHCVPKKVSPLNILQQPPQTYTDLNEILHTHTHTHTHKTTSIFVIDVKFHKNPLFRLRDVQFFQTAVTNLSYRYYFFTTTAARSVTSTI